MAKRGGRLQWLHRAPALRRIATCCRYFSPLSTKLRSHSPYSLFSHTSATAISSMVSMGYHEGVDCKFFRAGMRRHFAPMLWECKDRLNQCIDVKISVAVKWPNHREGREL